MLRKRCYWMKVNCMASVAGGESPSIIAVEEIAKVFITMRILCCYARAIPHAALSTATKMRAAAEVFSKFLAVFIAPPIRITYYYHGSKMIESRFDRFRHGAVHNSRMLFSAMEVMHPYCWRNEVILAELDLE